MPLIRTTLRRLVAPLAMVTEERGTFKSFAKNSMQASLARPSTGGALSASLSASPSSPVTASCLERGWTFTAKVMPALFSRMVNILISHAYSLVCDVCVLRGSVPGPFSEDGHADAHAG